jgi:hypothetical protein
VVVAAGSRHDGAVSATTTPGDPAQSEDADRPGRDPDLPWWRRIDRSLLVVSLVVAIGIMIVLRGVLAGVTGDDRSDVPAQIERVDPVPDAVRVLAQTRVFIDLESGYTGRLVIDGVELETIGIDELGDEQVEPGQQVDVPAATIYEPGNATLTFVPSADAPIEEFDEGLHEATVIFWRIEDGPARSRSFTWTFNTV